MYDYTKLWIEDLSQIDRLINNSILNFRSQFELKTGEIINYPIKCQWNLFEFELKSATRLQIAGSLHKHWNDGNNSNDFNIVNVREAIIDLCEKLHLNPSLALIKNLEVGVNICPAFSANEIIGDIISYKNKRPYWPYEGCNNEFYFIEFKKGNYYFKIYDKGKQYNISNTMRIEFKAMVSAELKQAGANCLFDLMNEKVLQVLGRKLMQFTENIVFDDSTINPELLDVKEEKLYNIMRNPNRQTVKKLSIR